MTTLYQTELPLQSLNPLVGIHLPVPAEPMGAQKLSSIQCIPLQSINLLKLHKFAAELDVSQHCVETAISKRKLIVLFSHNPTVYMCYMCNQEKDQFCSESAPRTIYSWYTLGVAMMMSVLLSIFCPFQIFNSDTAKTANQEIYFWFKIISCASYE